MASSSVIVIDDSDTEDIQLVEDSIPSASDSCQICHISFEFQSLEAKQAHYEEHFGEDRADLEVTEGDRDFQLEHHPSSKGTKHNDDMFFSSNYREENFWFVGHGGSAPKNYSPGLVSVIRQALLKSHSKGQTTRAALCCNGAVHIATQWYDKTWGCGYRNFLMSCTALMSQEVQPLYPSQLMENPEPGVRNLQQWIESAWTAGFDQQGKEELYPLLGRKKWIGTVEISVAFSSRGIPTKLVDFADVDKSAEIVTKWIVDYFDPAESSTSKHLGSLLTSEKKTIGDALRGASPVKVTDRMPLILQHAGHSRTIIGYEMTKNGTVNLLTFDPARSPPTKIRQAGLSQSGNASASTSTSTSKRKQFIDRVLHPRSNHRSVDDKSGNMTIDRKGKKRQASPSPGPSKRPDDGNRLVKRVRGGVQNGESMIAANKAAEVIDLDNDSDDDEIQIVEPGPPKGSISRSTISNLVETLDPSDVLSHFRLKPANVGRKKKYQILYFTMEDVLTPDEMERRKIVHSTPVKQSSAKNKRRTFHI